ncbi:glutamate racemase [Mahella sp.]|uniref:glutamate racemase n=1 Tax=Mahella sp. TaxID=2798721 RepID=UPI0025BD4C6F|nr:glutamate racemase [Mahella sp.]MBZ4664959.1 glutamate racemase [Mahella sp.]MDK2902144.1 glutamate racemase [Clostridiales bacterium]
MDNRPIGVFDSGVGGLTVVKEIMKQLPAEDIIYFGDTARVPYGTRSRDTVIKFTLQSVRFLMSQGIKAVVLACNTASAISLEVAQQQFDVPILGVIEGGATTAVRATKNKRVGIIGTEGTINSGAYEKAIKSLDDSIETFAKPCPLFVPLVEEGLQDSEIAYMAALEYLSFFKDKSIDTLLMGCTHYPLMADTIRRVVGAGVNLINPAEETALILRRVLARIDILNDGANPPQYRYFASDDGERFKKIGSNFLKCHISSATKVDIERY